MKTLITELFKIRYKSICCAKNKHTGIFSILYLPLYTVETPISGLLGQTLGRFLKAKTRLQQPPIWTAFLQPATYICFCKSCRI